jgi:hypothetical protein
MTGMSEPEGGVGRRLRRARRLKVSRLVAGALLAPLVPPVMHTVLSGYGAVPGYHDKAAALSMALIGMSYGLSVPLGGLLLALFHNREKVTAPRAITYAVLAGLAAGCLFGLAIVMSDSVTPGAIALFGVVGAIWGFFVSAAFCLIAGIPLKGSPRRSMA